MRFRDALSDIGDTVGETIQGENLKLSRSNRTQKRFLGCTFETNFLLELNNFDILFIDCKFLEKDRTTVINGLGNSEIRLEGCEVKGSIEFIGIPAIEIATIEVSGSIYFRRSSYNGIIIENYKGQNPRINRIHFEEMSGDTTLELVDLNVGQITFDKTVLRKLRFWNGSYDFINLNSIENLKNLQILGDEYQEKMIRIGELEMKYLNLEGDVFIKFAEIKKMDLTPFSNKSGFMRWQGVLFSNNSEVNIQHSNLSNVQWNGVDFSKARLIFDWSKLSDLEMSNIVWPNGHTIDSNMDVSTNQNRVLMLRAKTEVYRQLKKVSLNESNNIEALKFYRNEMATYWERVKLDKTETWANRFLIRVNKVTSNFGQSYWYPIWWMLGFHLVLCSAVWILEANANGWLWDYSKLDIALGLKEYFTWLIPIYDVPETWLSASVIIGVFMRIFSGFFIYHIIKATRKFGKV